MSENESAAKRITVTLRNNKVSQLDVRSPMLSTANGVMTIGETWGTGAGGPFLVAAFPIDYVASVVVDEYRSA